MLSIRVVVPSPKDVFSALQSKLKARKWKATCRMCSDGSIVVRCENDTALCQVETFLDMIVTGEYQIADMED